jgi:leucyl aminopeptidase
LVDIQICSPNLLETDLKELNDLVEAVFYARNMVNEPLSYLTAEKMAQEFQIMATESGFKIEVFDKAKIESLKFGGLLAVNKGSENPPTFSILEWKPENAKNEKPIVLVGKGLVFDSGGLSLKPTPNSMDYMKCDMSGAAAVAGAIYALAKAKIPVYVVGLIPATENSISAKAYVPGDVIKMHSGKTVEVLNTDAEGRLVLADALSYAKRYNPCLVLDIATLTGSAAYSIGKEGTVIMGKTEESDFEKLEKSGNETYERVVRFPFWDEYDEYIKSSIADIKNIGGSSAGAITAGKFLAHFVDYNWIHLDIAGPAFQQKEESYWGIGGSGVGVRLFFNFIKKYFE